MVLAFIASGLVLLAVAGYVVAPLFTRQRVLIGLHPPLHDPGLERERAYGALSEAEYDFRMGKLDEYDYLEVREQLLNQAAMFLGEEETTAEWLDRRVEEEIAAAVHRLAEDPGGRSALPTQGQVGR